MKNSLLFEKMLILSIKRYAMHLIRLAEKKDIPALISLLNYLFEQEADFTPQEDKQEKGLELILSNPAIGHILIIEVQGEIRGMLSILYAVSTALGGKVGTLEDFVIDPDYRNKGLGSLLFESMLHFAKEEGCLRTTLLTDAHNVAAQKFYKNFGFNQSAMIPFRKVIHPS